MSVPRPLAGRPAAARTPSRCSACRGWQALRRARGAARRQLRAARGRAGRGRRARTARARRRCCRSSPACSAPSSGRGVGGPVRRSRRDRLGAAAARALLEAVGGARTCGCSRAWSRRRRRRTARSRRCSSRRACASAPTSGVERLSGGNRQRVNVALGAARATRRVLALDEPSAALDPAQRERLWEFVGAARRSAATSVLFSTHHLGEVQRYADARDRARRRRAAVRRRARGADRRARAPSEGWTLRSSRSWSDGVTREPPSAGRGRREDGCCGKDLADPAPLAPAGRDAGHLPDRDRAADRPRDLARAGQADGGGRRRNAAGADDRSWRAARAGRPLRRPAVQPGERRCTSRSRDEAIQQVKSGQGARGRRDPARHRRADRHRAVARAASKCSTTATRCEQSLVRSQLELARSRRRTSASPKQIQRAAGAGDRRAAQRRQPGRARRAFEPDRPRADPGRSCAAIIARQPPGPERSSLERIERFASFAAQNLGLSAKRAVDDRPADPGAEHASAGPAHAAETRSRSSSR